jgi:hypothetical protein
MTESSKQNAIEEADKLLQKWKGLGYDPEKLSPLDESDALYMALANKRRTGKLEMPDEN